jgi:hypothetical protein
MYVHTLITYYPTITVFIGLSFSGYSYCETTVQLANTRWELSFCLCNYFVQTIFLTWLEVFQVVITPTQYTTILTGVCLPCHLQTFKSWER